MGDPELVGHDSFTKADLKVDGAKFLGSQFVDLSMGQFVWEKFPHFGQFIKGLFAET